MQRPLGVPANGAPLISTPATRPSLRTTIVAVPNGDDAARCCIKRAVSTAAGCKAKHTPATNVAAEPTRWIDRAKRIVQLGVTGGRRQGGALASQRIPSLCVVA